MQIFSKEASTEMFSCEYCEIFENIFFIEHLRCLFLLFCHTLQKISVIKKNFCQYCKLQKRSLGYIVKDFAEVRKTLALEFIIVKAQVYRFSKKEP